MLYACNSQINTLRLAVTATKQAETQASRLKSWWRLEFINLDRGIVFSVPFNTLAAERCQSLSDLQPKSFQSRILVQRERRIQQWSELLGVSIVGAIRRFVIEANRSNSSRGEGILQSNTEWSQTKLWLPFYSTNNSHIFCFGVASGSSLCKRKFCVSFRNC